MNVSILQRVLDDAALYGGMTTEELEGYQAQWESIKSGFPVDFHPVIEDRIKLVQTKINQKQ